MADSGKVCVNCENIVPDLHKELKESIERKLKEKEWSTEEKDEFRRQFFKIYEETVELSLRENVIVQKEEDNPAVSVVREEMEPVNKDRAIEVNQLCAKSEDFLTSVIQKRKHYPKKIRDCLQKQYTVEFDQLCELGNKIPENLDLVEIEEKIDFAECENYLQKLKSVSNNISLLKETLPEQKEKAKRLHTATETDFRMKGNEMHQVLFSKRSITFDSILATPTKDISSSETHNESGNSLTKTLQKIEDQVPAKKLKGVERKLFPDKHK